TPSVILNVFSVSCYATPQDLHSFPTRRSSDLKESNLRPDRPASVAMKRATHLETRGVCPVAGSPRISSDRRLARQISPRSRTNRSEEHTSELQSRRDLVCRLLLEKKKTKSNY